MEGMKLPDEVWNVLIEIIKLFLQTKDFFFLISYRFYLVSGGVPLIICGVTAAVSLDNYGSGEQAP